VFDVPESIWKEAVTSDRDSLPTCV